MRRLMRAGSVALLVGPLALVAAGPGAAGPAVAPASAALQAAPTSGQHSRHLYRLDDLTRTAPLAKQAADAASSAFWSSQWAAARLGAPGVWDTARGTGVTVAVVDTGVDGTHPDLAGTVLPGAAFLGGSTSSRGNGWDDATGHGTFVAGLIAAKDSGGASAGLAPGARILPVKVFGPDGSADEVDIAHGVLWAAAHGAKVVNLSLGSAERDTVLADAIAEVTRRGVLVVASAGNAGLGCGVGAGVDPDECGDPVMYPAADPGVVGVGATDSGDARPAWSETGSAVDIAAPGAGVGSAVPQGRHATGDGTSFAAPFVAAAAALVIERAPHLAPAQVQGLLQTTAKDLGATGPDPSFGWGLVAPGAALAAVARGEVAIPEAASVSLAGLPARATYGQPLSLTVRASLGAYGVPGVRLGLWRRSAPAAPWLPAGASAVLPDAGSATVVLVARLPGQYAVGTYPSGSEPLLDHLGVTLTPRGSLGLVPGLVVTPLRRGTVAVVRGSVLNGMPSGTAVVLQQLVRGAWVQVASVRASASGAFGFPGRPVGRAGAVLRVVVPPSGGFWATASGALTARR